MIQIGWVYNSSKHRQDLETIISLTQDQGTLDELGLGSIRDGFANIFFPGTTTIMTRAKYFLIVPWILEDIYKRNEDFGNFSQMLRTEEARVIENLKAKNDLDGLIGRDAGVKLKRMPSSIYWTGVKRYGIIQQDLAIAQLPSFFRKRARLDNSGANRRLTKEDKLADLYENTDSIYLTVEDLPKYPGLKNLKLELNKAEAQFIRKRVLVEEGDSLLAYLLKGVENRKELFLLDSFDKLVSYVGKDCPLQPALESALLFDQIMKGVYVRYNFKLSQFASEEIKEQWKQAWENYLKTLSKLKFSENSFDKYFDLFSITNNTIRFCKRWLSYIHENTINEAAIDELLREREVNLKGNERSRLNNQSLAQKSELPIGVSLNQSTGDVFYLSYRFFIARRILQDIYNGLTSKESDGQ